MKAYDFVTSQIVDVAYYDELTEDMVLLTQAQVGEIEHAREVKGRIYREGNMLKTNVDTPRDCFWNESTNNWEFSEELREKRIEKEQDEMWKRIKDRMQQAQAGGVYVKSVDKWFHTDVNALLNYFGKKMVIDYPEAPISKWKTMDQTYVDLTPELFKEVVIAVYNKGEAEFINSERHIRAMLEAPEPLLYDFSDGWGSSYYEITGEEYEH